ncbi:hypothetical protein HY415_02650 [Candidatus Kaiserbacteria bacterium]|nr:hypothetical protein [Candidatus Kaiserbacteria bacterium]
MKKATYRQLKDIGIRFLNLDPEGVDGDAIRKGTEGCSVNDVDRRLKAFLNNGLSFMMKGPSALIIDRTKPFNPAAFIGSGWTIWRGTTNGDGLTGEEEQDARSLELTEINFATVLFTACLEDGETSIIGEEKLARHIAAKHIRLDARIGQCLFEEKGQAACEWLYQTFGIRWFELSGTVLRNGFGSRCFLFLYRNNDGRWYWSYDWLGSNRDAENPSAVLAGST